MIYGDVCLDCKINIGSPIDYKAEWRTDTTGGDDMSRCNIAKNPLLPESSNSTTVMLDGRANKSMHDLQRSIIWSSIPYNERSMRTKMDEIASVCKINDIPYAIVEYAQFLYHKLINALEDNEYKRRRGKNDAGIRAAAVFISFQEDNKPRTYKEIATIFGIEPKYVSDGIKLFSEFFQSDMKVAVYTDYIDDFCNSLDLGEEIKARIISISDKADKLGILENHAPTSIVAGCIHYVSIENDLNISIADIEERCNVSAPTINKICSKLFRRAMDLTDD
jgi:transcription initiation factor TFIIIB Brf1 subunit/transcription initiation factor TFIIB